jgi:hypothetical protein
MLGDGWLKDVVSWKLGLDSTGEEIHRTALDRYVRLAKAVRGVSR